MRTSAGVLPFHLADGETRVLIAHMGGPLWARKDERAWSIVKGEYDAATEDPLDAARREWVEETGTACPEGEWLDLGEVRQSSKLVRAWAVAASPNLALAHSNLVEIEWPPRSGRRIEVPEIDRAEWCPVEVARPRLVTAQTAFLDRLSARLSPGRR